MGLETAAIIAAVAAAAPAIYGIGKDILGPGQGPINAAGAQKMADMQKAATAYGAYRPDQADARMKAMSQQLSAYQGAGNVLKAMYGGGGGPAGGTVTPGAGGYTKPTEGYSTPTGRTPIDPRTGGPIPDGWVDPEWSRNNQTPKPSDPRTTPPIIPPGAGGGIGAGSTGPMLTGPMSQSLAGQPDPMSNPMAAMLAGRMRY